MSLLAVIYSMMHLSEMDCWIIFIGVAIILIVALYIIGKSN